MKTLLSLGLIVAAASTLAACSSDEGTPRNTAGTGPIAGSGGQVGNAGAGGASAGTGGGVAGGAGGAGGSTVTPPAGNFGPAFVITPTDAGASVIDEDGSSGVSGGVILAQSATMTVPATVEHRDGAFCMKGTTAVVPDANSYGTHWGAELALDLLLVADPNAPPPAAAADAGTDAGAPAGTLTPAPWPYGNVTGFAFTITGSAIPTSFRFKGLPNGADSSLETWCNTVNLALNPSQAIGFGQISFECWNPGNPTLADATIPTIATTGAAQTTRPNPRELRSISWQVPADLNSQYAFDFCVEDLKPIIP